MKNPKSNAIIISIHPQWVNQIFSGEKTWDHRGWIIPENVTRVYIYCTAPVKSLVGRFEPGPGWDGAEYNRFHSEWRYSYPILNLQILKMRIDPKSVAEGFHAPQRFCYVDESLFDDGWFVNAADEWRKGKARRV